MTRFARLLTVLLVTGVFACDGAGPTESTAPALPDAAAQPEVAAGWNGWGNRDDDHGGAANADLSRVAELRRGGNTRGAERAREVIDERGGTVRLGDFQVIVPPGAVERATTFEITLLPPQAGRAHAAATFSPHNKQFKRPVILLLPHYNTDAWPDPDPDILWWNRGRWVEYPTWPTFDGRIMTFTDHFSLYATSRRGITMVGG